MLYSLVSSMEGHKKTLEGDYIHHDAWFFHRKAWERYNLIIESADFGFLRMQIENGQAKIVNSAWLPNCYVYKVLLFKNGQPISMQVVYNPTKKEFVTAASPNNSSLRRRQEYERHAHYRGTYFSQKPKKHWKPKPKID